MVLGEWRCVGYGVMCLVYLLSCVCSYVFYCVFVDMCFCMIVYFCLCALCICECVFGASFVCGCGVFLHRRRCSLWWTSLRLFCTLVCAFVCVGVMMCVWMFFMRVYPHWCVYIRVKGYVWVCVEVCL